MENKILNFVSIGEKQLFQDEALCKELGVQVTQLPFSKLENINWKDYSLVILQHGKEESPFPFLNQAEKDNPAIIKVIYTFENPDAVLSQKKMPFVPDHIITEAYLGSEEELISLLVKSVSSGTPGLQRYMNTNKMLAEVEVCDSEYKEMYLNIITLHAVEHGFSPQLIFNISNALDEMISNAIYNAPIDKKGAHIYKDLPRTNRVQLEDEQMSIITYGFDDAKLGVCIRDPFGSLNKKTVWEVLEKSYQQDQGVHVPTSGGGGLGIYTILKNVHHLIINIKPKTYTEFIIFIKKTRDRKLRYSPSLSVFSE